MSERERQLEALVHHLRYCMTCHDNASGFVPECRTRLRMWRELGLGETSYPVHQDPPHPEAQPQELSGERRDGITEVTIHNPRNNS